MQAVVGGTEVTYQGQALDLGAPYARADFSALLRDQGFDLSRLGDDVEVRRLRVWDSCTRWVQVEHFATLAELRG